MKTSKIIKLFIILHIGILFILSSCERNVQPQWPEQTNETAPWTRWWWHGSAVDEAGLTANLEALKEAGFGGVEITPIYDVKGYEDKSIPFQSEEWMEMLEYTLKEAKRLGLGIDLANASGWPFGGPWIDAENACKNFQYQKYQLQGGEKLNKKIEFIQQPMVRAVGKKVDIANIKFPISNNTNLQELALDQVRFEKPLPLQTLMAYSEEGKAIELTSYVDENGVLNWKTPEGSWTLYAIFQGWHGKMVERAGTGGEGNVVDHFSEEATKAFLADFDINSKNIDLSDLRAFFNDSYEVDDAFGNANWTPLFFDEFEQRRGYDLKEFLPALVGDSDEKTNKRVLCDYRETISDLLLYRFTKVWADWAESHHSIIRNQSHGSPANILDLYDASHIPETEGIDPLRIKMASSVGNTSGKKLVSCEAATWLDEHFLSTLSAVKENADRYFANGVNHIVYHGTPYSPVDEKWPGWMFYAAVHFAPTNTWWNELKSINQYISNCQSFLQNSKPNNDILVYFPIYQTWMERDLRELPHFGGHAIELTSELGNNLLQKGFLFDYISDRQIQKLEFNNGIISSGGVSYKTIVIPNCDYIPLETLKKLFSLAESGATVIFENKIPAKVPGLKDFRKKESDLQQIVKELNWNKEKNYSVAQIGKGKIRTGANVVTMLSESKVQNEQLAELGLWFKRIERSEGTCYFISNWSEKKVEQWITLNSAGKEAVWFNPSEQSLGKATIRKKEDGNAQVYLQLKRGETLILQWYPTNVNLTNYPVWEETKVERGLDNEWEVDFEKGGPTLPVTYKTNKLTSWTEVSDELQKFSGTASYKNSFSLPSGTKTNYMLDLGEVHESATVVLNGTDIGTLVGPEFRIILPDTLLRTQNSLEIKVTNLMANRIIDMDKNGINYKKFYNINFAAHLRENVGADGNFTAANWEPLPSGLLGPVILLVIKPKQLK